MKKLKVIILAFALVMLSVTTTFGEEEIQINWFEGPVSVNVGTDLAKLNLPEEYVFANEEDTKKLMEYFGNPLTEIEIGSVFPKDETKNWFIVFEYESIGYVDDKDSDIDAEAILESFKEGDEVSNEEREKMGAPAIKTLGWYEEPHYDSKTNNLAWTVLLESEGEKFVNYNTRILGRHGVTYVTLVAGTEEIKALMPELEKILNGFSYVEGKRYADFVPGKDKLSELGLTALIAGSAGAAASKVGFFAKLLLFFKKGWILLIAGGAALYKKIKGRFFGEDTSSNNDY